MRVLVVGGGGREHALCWQLARSKRVERVYCAPGNGGISEVAECIDISSENLDGLAKFAAEKRVDLAVVGPEAPLAAGIVDRFEEKGLRCFGPTRGAAQLEASKVFAKNLMRKHAIPTADFKVFKSAADAKSYLKAAYYPVVVKADGLAAGKGVVVCEDRDAAVKAVERIMEQRAFGAAGERVVIEEALGGEEVSVQAVTDGRTIVTLESARDHKRAFDGDRGPNTGGMGAYSPSTSLSRETRERIEAKVLVPAVHAIKREGHPFKGVLYAGLMLTPTGPKVLEFNCRLGDPEAQAVLFRLRSDLLDLLMATVEGRLEETDVSWDPRPSLCVVMASGGYPGDYAIGREIRGLSALKGREDVQVFHAGTKRIGDRHFTAGGRVLGVTALGETLAKARETAYAACAEIAFDEAHYRRDLAAEARGT